MRPASSFVWEIRLVNESISTLELEFFAEIEEETMKGTTGLTEDYGKYCDAGAASGQSACGQTGDECDDWCCC